MNKVTIFFHELLEAIHLDRMEHIKKIESRYGSIFSIEIYAWLSLKEHELCIKKNSKVRILDLDEIMCAPEELHVDFIKHQLVPLADCFDNDFFVYNIKSKSFCLFNIVDESSFEDYKSIYEFLTSA